MSGHPERALTNAEQSELRHDLRTPFNHVLGYAEMLLESADEDGLQALVPGLTRLVVDARDLLGVVNGGLAADRPVQPEEVAALSGRIQQGVPPLTARVEALTALARQGGHESALGDLGRIALSLGALAALTGGRLIHDTAAVPCEAGPAAEPPREASAEREALPPGRVLVVDDNETNRDLLCRRLEREGLTVTSARDGREALDLLGKADFDLVLLDIVMPVVDGYEVLCRVKSTPAWRDIPVVMISALDELQSVVRCIQSGAEDYLPKPFDPVLLRARVGACLEKKRLRDRELEYLRGVAVLEASASEVETGKFDAEKLNAVAGRDDELGRLARVFQRMATEVQARERRLKEQVAQLKIEIDMVKLSRQVQEVTDAPVFDSLKGARERLKQKGRLGDKE